MIDLEFNGVKGLSRTWVEAGGGVDPDEHEPGSRAAGSVDLGFTPDPDRAQDLVMLRALLDDSELRPGEREAFGGMLEGLEADRRKYDVLSLKQRAWATGRALELGIELGDPAERNRNVPRGREVAPAPALLNRPLSPPGRRAGEELPTYSQVSAARAADIADRRSRTMVTASEVQARVDEEVARSREPAGGQLLFNGVPAGESPLYLPEGAPIPPLEAYGSREAMASTGRGPLVGGPCPDCGLKLLICKGGWACINGHGYGDPNPQAAPGPFEEEAGRAAGLRSEKPFPTTPPDTISRRPSSGVVGARRRPQPLGRTK